MHHPSFRYFVVVVLVSLCASFAVAQQTGSITGTVTATDGSALPGVTVEARSANLPRARVTTSDASGLFRFPELPPGKFTVSFSLSGMEPLSRTVDVLLFQTATLNVSMGVAGVRESVTVTADSSLVNPQSGEIHTALPEAEIQKLPIGQEYRDLLKLTPAVQYTEDTIRGPSAGGSGQDNVYLFDGVNVSLPQYGTLPAEPSTHDIQQVSVVKGGARATDFNRAAGFTIDTVSKGGTNEIAGQVSYQVQTDAMRGDITGESTEDYKEGKDWAVANLGGPVLRDRLYFYGSYYRPTIDRTERSNVYGPTPDYNSTRNEYFGKLTYTPTASILLNGSYRDSGEETEWASVGNASAASTALNEDSKLKIGIIEGSWILNQRSFVSAKFTDFKLDTSSLPYNMLDVVPSTAPGTHLDVTHLEQYGLVSVPCPSGRPAGTPCQTRYGSSSAFNTFIDPIITRYGYLSDGVPTGGGEAGVGSTINSQDFSRQSAQAGYDFNFGQHDLHVGYQWFKDGEDLARVSNGWGVLSVPGGNVKFNGTPVYYQAQFTRSIAGGTGGNNIHSEIVSHNVEVNDTFHMKNWTFNFGVLTSNDTLYGQGLKEDSSTISGYVAAPGHQYKMYEIPWEKTIQPRLGAIWAYNGIDNVYGSYARYVPSTSSLPRAASWDRAILGLTTRVHFDANGDIIGSEQVASSSGKLFVEDLDPRYTDEYLIGTAQQFSNRWSGRVYGRYRYSTNFWEDTNNNARQRWAPEGYPTDLYIPDLADKLAQIGSGSTYVIAELDGAFTKYYEATIESEWRGDRAALRGTYTWSHYYGTFDQDNTSIGNDDAIFIGSSNLADGPGRQIWDFKYGDLRGDRRHLLKLYGSYEVGWNASVGAFWVYQSGQPWEAWNYELYKDLPGFGTSTSDTDRFAEPAGSRRTPSHYQLDLTYTQNIPVRQYNVQLQFDVFNAFDKQTGYNYQPSVHSALFGTPRDYFDPRRYQVALRFLF